MRTLRRTDYPKENVVLTPSVAVMLPLAKMRSFQHAYFSIPARLRSVTLSSPMTHAVALLKSFSSKCSARQYRARCQRHFLPRYPARFPQRRVESTKYVAATGSSTLTSPSPAPTCKSLPWASVSQVQPPSQGPPTSTTWRRLPLRHSATSRSRSTRMACVARL